MTTYTYKPRTVEAMQWTKETTIAEVRQWLEDNNQKYWAEVDADNYLWLRTEQAQNDDFLFTEGDWMIIEEDELNILWDSEFRWRFEN